MALHKRTEIDRVLADIGAGKAQQVYLCFGERYLCRQAAQQIEAEFTKQGPAAVHAVDGAQEDNGKVLSRLLSFSLLPGTQIYRVSDTRLFLSKEAGAQLWEKAFQAFQSDRRNAALRSLAALLGLGGVSPEGPAVFSDIAADQWQKLFGFAHPAQELSWADQLVREAGLSPAPAATDAIDRFSTALETGFPAGNVLLLLAENVDKRKKLFNQIKAFGEIIDCSVADGGSRVAVQEQKDVVREMARRTLAEMGKSIEPKALEHLFDRVGFHPVAVVMEMEKLALFIDERQTITRADLDLMVARTREDAIYELTEAFGKKDAAASLIILNNLIRDGIHTLAILAALRNYLRKLLIFRSLQLTAEPQWHNRLNANEFQNSYLPALKQTGVWPDLLKGHPYGLFMSFTKAAEFSPQALQGSFELLLEAEFRLKGSPLPQLIVLEELLLSLLRLVGSRKPPDPGGDFPC